MSLQFNRNWVRRWFSPATRVLATGVVGVFLFGCAKDPAVAKREYLRSGDDYAAQGKLNEAIVQYRNAVQQDPRFGDARYKLAETLIKTGNVQGAYREYIRAADLLPDNLDVQIKAGTMHLVAGQFEDARTLADKVLAKNPTSVEAHILRGNAQAGLKDFDSAIAEVQAAVQSDPDRGLSYANLGQMQFLKGNAAEAEQAFKQAVTLAPQSVPAHEALANFYWSTGKRDLAENSLKTALAVEPKSVSVNRALAYLYLSLGRSAAAEAPLKIVADETKDANAQMMLADYYRATKRGGQALEVLDALAADPKNHAAARARKSAMLYADGRKADAYAAVQDALDKEPKSAAALIQKAALLTADRDYDQALSLAQAATTAAPSSVEAWFAVGQIQSRRGHVDDAVEAYRDVVKLSPKFLPALLELSRLSLTIDKPGDALSFAENALSVQPGNADATLFKARALMAQGSVARAEEPMKLLTTNLPGSSAVQSQLGTMYMQKRDFAAARTAYERALRTDTANAEALAGLAGLDIASKQPARARTRVEAALALHRDAPPLLLVAARTYNAVGDRPAAERAARRVVEIDPSNLDAYAFLGQLLASERRLDEAVAQYEEVTKRRPKSITGPTMTGVLLEMQDKRAEAAKRYEMALSVDSHAAVAANNLAMYHLDTGGSLDVALQLAQTAKAQLPDRHEVNDTLGWIYVKKNLPALAIPPLLQSVEKDPKNPVYLYHLGMAYLASGDKTKARDAIEKALSLNSSFPGAAEAKQALAGLT